MIILVRNSNTFDIREYSEYSLRILYQIAIEHFTGYLVRLNYTIISVTVTMLF